MPSRRIPNTPLLAQSLRELPEWRIHEYHVVVLIAEINEAKAPSCVIDEHTAPKSVIAGRALGIGL
ncbi:MAG TPA: hypothetical protein VNH18_34325 [Bryobacteraceae bacterium]|nr:hypothetical protein [Bryobacteraceae bacterium]